MVIIDVDLWSGKDVAIAQAKQEPRIDLYAAVSVLTGTVAAQIVPIRFIPDTVEILLRILVTELSEDAEAVALKEKLRLGEEVDAAVEHEGNGHRDYGAHLRGVTGIHTERHQGTSAHYETEVGGIARSAQDVVMQVSAGYLLLAQFFFGQCGNAVVGGNCSLFLGIKGGGEQHQCDKAEYISFHVVRNVGAKETILSRIVFGAIDNNSKDVAKIIKKKTTFVCRSYLIYIWSKASITKNTL